MRGASERSPAAVRASALAMLLTGGEGARMRAVRPAVTHATEAIELGARSVSGLVGVAGRVTRSQRALRPAEWERELVTLRYRIWDSAPGPERADALAVYCAHAASARRAIGGRRATEARQRVAAVLRLERRLLAGRHLSRQERTVATRAVERSLADVEGRPLS